MKKRNLILTSSIVLIGVALIAYAITRHASVAPRTFNMTEYGVALTLPGSLNELTYTAQDEGQSGKVLHMHIATGCDIGAFYEIQKNAIGKSGTTWTKELLEQFAAPQGTKPAQVKEFTDFYLVFEPNPDTCATSEQGKVTETQKKLALWNALTTAHYMQ